MILRRYILAFLFFSMIVPYTYAAMVLDHFAITPYSNTVAAGAALSINIVARNSTDLTDTDYNGAAYLTASSGAGTFAVAAPISFSGGVAALGVTLYASGSINLTVKDGSVSNVAGWCDVMPLAPHSALFLRQSPEIQEYQTPGIFPGYAEAHGYTGVTISSDVPVSVSVVAVDQYYNAVTGTAWTCTVEINGSDYCNLTGNTVTGMALFSWKPSDVNGVPMYQNFIISTSSWHPGSGTPMINSLNYITIPTLCYMWTNAPAKVVAGVPFSVTVVATTLSNSTSANAAWTNGLNFNLNSRLLGSRNPGHGSLLNGNLTLTTSGTGTGTFTDTVAESIQLVPVTSDSAAAGKTFNEGGYQIIQVQPSVPAAMSIACPSIIQARSTATISVTVRDAYQNLVPGAFVNFAKTAGSADVSMSPAQVQTNASGVAAATFTGGYINETAAISVSVGSVAPQSVNIQISVASISGKDMINSPNPFNPNTQKTTIEYFLKARSKVEIKIYDAFGRLVLGRTLNPGEGSGDFANATTTGGASFNWDGRNGAGTVVGNGIYTLKLTATNDVEVQHFTRRVGVLK
jgi:hypothetical protein